MDRENEKGVLPAGKNRLNGRPEYYPGSRTRITDPFYLHQCTECGKRSWSLTGQLYICPLCGGRMELVNDTQR